MSVTAKSEANVHKVCLIPGDGIGPEISQAMQRVVEASGVKIDWELAFAGEAQMKECGHPLPQETIDCIKRNKVAIKGPITTPVGSGFRSVNVALRKELDLYVNLRPVFSLPSNGSSFKDIDLVIVRENTEDLYAGIEFKESADETLAFIDYLKKHKGVEIKKDSGISIKPISISASERIINWAFKYAKQQGRTKLTAVHKANILKESDGLFLDCARRLAAQYPEIVFEDKIVDACCMGLVLYPQNFDLLVLPNLYGDIVSDLCAGLIGGLGMAPGANIGDEYAVFEAVHGSAPDIAQKDIANPSALILSACMMLRHLREFEAADRITSALRELLAKQDCLTADLRFNLFNTTEGALGTQAFANALIAQMNA